MFSVRLDSKSRFAFERPLFIPLGRQFVMVTSPLSVISLKLTMPLLVASSISNTELLINVPLLPIPGFWPLTIALIHGDRLIVNI